MYPAYHVKVSDLFKFEAVNSKYSSSGIPTSVSFSVLNKSCMSSGRSRNCGSKDEEVVQESARLISLEERRGED